MRIPVSAPLPVPTMIAVGVARPIAQGQAMISTLIAAVSASVKRGSGPSSNQAPNVSAARTSTSGTKTALTRSARRWMGAFEPCASLDQAHDLGQDRVAARPASRGSRSVPGRVQRRADDRVAGALRRPASASPVSIDSSTRRGARRSTHAVHRDLLARPHAHQVARLHLGERARRPRCPSRTTRAVAGLQADQARTAPTVWPLARASSQRPARIRPMMIAADVEVRHRFDAGPAMTSGKSVTTTLYAPCRQRAHAHQRVHVASPCRAARHAARRKRPPAQNWTKVAGRITRRLTVSMPTGPRRPEHEGHDPRGDGDGDQGAEAEVALILEPRDGVLVDGRSEGLDARRGDLGADVVPRGLHGGHELVTSRDAGVDEHGRALRGQVHARLEHAVRLAQEALDAIDAGGAGHALDGEHDADRSRLLDALNACH